MNSHVEDYTKWSVEALTRVPPESLEYSDLVGLVLELQTRLLYELRQNTWYP